MQTPITTCSKLPVERKKKEKNGGKKSTFRNQCSLFQINISEKSDELLAKSAHSSVLALLGTVGDQLCRHFKLGEMSPMYGVYVRCDLMDITTCCLSWGYRLTLDIKTWIFFPFRSNPDKLGVNRRKEGKHRALLLSTQYPDGINLISPRNPVLNCNIQADWNSGLA